MADEDKIAPTSRFTREFSAALREVMAARGISGNEVARTIGRGQGFVSERTSGKRPCDTDIIAGVAKVAGVDAKTITRETLRLMRRGKDEGGGSLHPLPGGDGPTPPNVSDLPERLVAKISDEPAGEPED